MHFALNGSNSATNPKSVVFRTAALVPRFPVLYKNRIVFGWINDLIYPAWILSCLFEPGSCLREPRKIPFFAMFDGAILQDIIDTYLSRYFIHLLHLQHLLLLLHYLSNILFLRFLQSLLLLLMLYQMLFLILHLHLLVCFL